MLVVLKTLKTNQRLNYKQLLNLHEDSFQNHYCVYFLSSRGVTYAMRKIIKCKNVTFLKLLRNWFEF